MDKRFLGMTFFLIIAASTIVAQGQAKKPFFTPTPEQIAEYEKVKQSNTLDFFRVKTPEDKSKLQEIQKKLVQRQATLSKQGRVLSEDEKIQLSLIKDDLKMIDAGLNPLIMTRDERAQILKQIDESITKPMPVKNVDKKAGDKKGKKK